MDPQPVNLHHAVPYAICRLLSFCANVAACLPFKKCDEPHSLLHLINSTISRRGDFVLSAQKSSLESASDAAPITTQDSHPVPDAMNGVQQRNGLNVQIQADIPSVLAAVLAGDAEVTQIALFNPKTSVSIQKCHPYTGSLNSNMSWGQYRRNSTLWRCFGAC